MKKNISFHVNNFFFHVNNLQQCGLCIRYCESSTDGRGMFSNLTKLLNNWSTLNNARSFPLVSLRLTNLSVRIVSQHIVDNIGKLLLQFVNELCCIVFSGFNITEFFLPYTRQLS